MNTLFEIFNNREVATFSWIIVLLVVLVIKRDIRKSIGGLLRILFSKQMLIIITLMVIYTGLEIMLLYRVGLWNEALIKETIYWTFGSAFILLVNSKNAFEDKTYIKRTVLNTIKLIVIIQFIVNLYTFNLIAEIILIPIVTFIAVTNVYFENTEKLTGYYKVTTSVLIIFGLVMVTISMINIISNHENYFTFEYLRKFLLPFLLVIGYMPFIYMFALYSVYEILYKRIRIFMGKEEARYAKIQIFRLCNFNIWKLKRLEAANRNKLLRKNDKKSIAAIIREYGDKNAERSSPENEGE